MRHPPPKSVRLVLSSSKHLCYLVQGYKLQTCHLYLGFISSSEELTENSSKKPHLGRIRFGRREQAGQYYSSLSRNNQREHLAHWVANQSICFQCKVLKIKKQKLYYERWASWEHTNSRYLGSNGHGNLLIAFFVL